MKLIICTDLNNGMLFNNRRQSKDKELINHICNLINNEKLWITSFSEDLFKDKINYNLILNENFENIGENDFCFIENISLKVFEKKLDEIILYNWNRTYPADTYLDISLEDWILESELDIEGLSHEKITQKIYKRGDK